MRITGVSAFRGEQQDLKEIKLKKIIFLVLIVLVSLTFFVVEPFSYNPFHHPEMSAIESSLSYSCHSDNLGIKSNADSALEKYMLSNEFLGVSAGFFKDGCGTYIGSSGYSDKRHLKKFRTNSITRIASITKPMTAIAIMQLYEKGLVDLDSPIQAYLPDFPKNSNVVTVRHILSHTSGLPHYESKFDAMSFTNYQSIDSAIDSIAKRGFVSMPGEKYIYSSFAYTVLGSVVEKVSNANFGDYLRENIWEKSGMVSTSLEKDHSLIDKSRLYIKDWQSLYS